MRKFFVDTNIIVDLVADRKPFSKFAIDLFDKAEKGKVLLFTSSHSVATTHYILKKYVAEKELRSIILNLLDYLSIIAVDENVLKRGLRSKHKDFEDSIQIICAASISSLDYIITRNKKDFAGSEVPVFAPDEIKNLL